ncbi:hypothetical protein HZH68_003286 [Vespula germanica]|uniref:Uncharacterized protein n=1 Tax=Vespula germanica TaxID=30212 RepID=A0A834NNY8_VESGE|nr:hypothetical protein HZH68_003286 [Vespula germanica]
MMSTNRNALPRFEKKKKRNYLRNSSDLRFSNSPIFYESIDYISLVLKTSVNNRDPSVRRRNSMKTFSVNLAMRKAQRLKDGNLRRAIGEMVVKKKYPHYERFSILDIV